MSKKDQSPCVSCERADKNKNQCLEICDRLDAFRHGNEWEGVPIPTEEEMGKGEGGKSEPQNTEQERSEPQKEGKGEARLCSRCRKYPATRPSGLCGYCEGVEKRAASAEKRKEALEKPVAEKDLFQLAKVLRKEIGVALGNLADKLSRIDGMRDGKISAIEKRLTETEEKLDARLRHIEGLKQTLVGLADGSDSSELERMKGLIVTHTHDAQGRAALPLSEMTDDPDRG